MAKGCQLKGSCTALPNVLEGQHVKGYSKAETIPISCLTFSVSSGVRIQDLGLSNLR